MAKKKSKKRTKKRKPPRAKGPMWKVWLFAFLFGDDAEMPAEPVRARMAKRGGIAKKIARFRR